MASMVSAETTANLDPFIFSSPLHRRANFTLFTRAGVQIAGNEFEPGRHLSSRMIPAPSTSSHQHVFTYAAGSGGNHHRARRDGVGSVPDGSRFHECSLRSAACPSAWCAPLSRWPVTRSCRLPRPFATACCRTALRYVLLPEIHRGHLPAFYTAWHEERSAHPGSGRRR